MSCFFIKPLTIGSRFSLFKASKDIISFLNSAIIFFAFSSINFKSSSPKFISSIIIYFSLLNISSRVFSLFLRKDNDFLIFSSFSVFILSLSTLNKESLEPIVNELIKKHDTNFKGVGQPVRVALTGSKFGPGLYDIVISLGKDEVEKRLGEVLK